MGGSYFSDRELGPRPRVKEEIPENVWGGIFTIIQNRIDDNSFGYKFPKKCSDAGPPLPPFGIPAKVQEGICGFDKVGFTIKLKAEIPDIHWPLNIIEIPPKLSMLDLLEFCYNVVAKPKPYQQEHFLYEHSHYSFDLQEGQASFREEINNIFARNGLVYELTAEGKIIRLAPPVLKEIITSIVFNTGDAALDSLLEAARTKYINPDINVRRESLEKLWDAWERLKTIERQNDKKASITSLLTKAATEPAFRETLDKEATEITRIGNTFMIRHSEVTQVHLQRNEFVDYLFHRLFALIRLLLQTTGRIK